MNKKLKWLIFIFVSISISVVLSYIFISKRNKKRRTDSKYDIGIIIQSTSDKQLLKSMYLAELMELSIDRKSNIYEFDEKEAENKLLKNPFVKSAKIKKYFPNAIFVDYEVRKPIALLHDFKNIGVDRDGFMFPLEPFFSYRDIPEIYLGDLPYAGKEQFFEMSHKNEKLDLAVAIYDVLGKVKQQETFFTVKRIDVSNSFLHSFGKKEIVIQVQHRLTTSYNERDVSFVFPRTVRLCVKDYEEQLSNYLSLNNKMMLDYKKQLKITENTPSEVVFGLKIIDMRILKLAFIDE